MQVRLDHIAIGVREIDPCGPFLEGQLGAARHHGGPSPTFNWAQWRFANGARLELISPAGEDGFMHRFIDRHGPGVHHVTLKVSSLPEAAAHARKHGYDVVGYDDSFPGWKECFLHPKQTGGIVIQLAETNEASTAPRRADTGVALVGLTLRVQSEDAARRQWQDLLGAELESIDGVLRMRWPDSPARIDAHCEPDGEPGPIAVVLSTDRSISVDAPTAALFGTQFELQRRR